jgi:cell division protein FtsQ
LQQVGPPSGRHGAGPAALSQPAPRPPAARHQVPRRRRRTLASLRRWIALLLIATSIGALSFWRASDIATLARLVPDHIEHALIQAGFGVDEVSVTGHRFTADSDIFDALDLPNVKTMIALDPSRVQARLQRLPWVASATISRIYPGRAHVQVTEREAFALWVRETNAMLIDSAGRTLSAVNPDDAPSLPRIAGEGAPDAAPALLATLAHFPAIASRLILSQRVTSRRWALVLTNGVQLELPSEGEATALADLLKDEAGLALLTRANIVIDLRSRSQIAWRTVGAS